MRAWAGGVSVRWQELGLNTNLRFRCVQAHDKRGQHTAVCEAAAGETTAVAASLANTSAVTTAAADRGRATGDSAAGVFVAGHETAGAEGVVTSSDRELSCEGAAFVCVSPLNQTTTDRRPCGYSPSQKSVIQTQGRMPSATQPPPILCDQTGQPVGAALPPPVVGPSMRALRAGPTLGGSRLKSSWMLPTAPSSALAS